MLMLMVIVMAMVMMIKTRHEADVLVSVLNKIRKLMRLTTSTPEVKVEHLKEEKEYNTN